MPRSSLSTTCGKVLSQSSTITRRTSGLAIAGLVCGIIGLFILPTRPPRAISIPGFEDRPPP